MNIEHNLSEEEVKQFKQAFSLFDKNNDGNITTEELKTVLKALGHYPNEAELEAMVEEVDADGTKNRGEKKERKGGGREGGFLYSMVPKHRLLLNRVPTGNGTIEFEEFLVMMSKQMASDDYIRAAFDAMDRNGDGYIDPIELKQVMENFGEQLSDDDVEEMIREADVDGDGRVDFEEFHTLMVNSRV